MIIIKQCRFQFERTTEHFKLRLNRAKRKKDCELNETTKELSQNGQKATNNILSIIKMQQQQQQYTQSTSDDYDEDIEASTAHTRKKHFCTQTQAYNFIV